MANPDHSDGIALMLSIPSDIADKIAVPGGLPPADLHVTVAYFGDLQDVNADGSDFLLYAQKVASETQPFTLSLNGITRFSTGDSDPLVVNADAPELEELRRRALEDPPVPPKREHGFSPHMTLDYLDPSDDHPIPRWDPVDANITEMVAAWGSDEVVLKLGDAGTMEKSEPVSVLTAAVDSASAAAPLPDGQAGLIPDSTLVITLDDDDHVLELVYSNPKQMWIRDSGEWQPVAADDDDPNIWDREWVDVTMDAIPAYDHLREDSDEINRGDLASE